MKIKTEQDRSQSLEPKTTWQVCYICIYCIRKSPIFIYFFLYSFLHELLFMEWEKTEQLTGCCKVLRSILIKCFSGPPRLFLIGKHTQSLWWFIHLELLKEQECAGRVSAQDTHPSGWYFLTECAKTCPHLDIKSQLKHRNTGEVQHLVLTSTRGGEELSSSGMLGQGGQV